MKFGHIMEIIDFGIRKKGFCGVGLKGSLEDFSSDTLHAHPFHQVLRISHGVALLEDGHMTRPQYGFLTAFIPAHVPHRTRVLGEMIEYQSLYFTVSLSGLLPKQIVIFRMSELGRSLLNQLNSGESLRSLNREMERDCLNLFIKVLEQDLRGSAVLLELRTPADDINRKLCAYIEQQYHRKITAADCASIASLSFRQLSRRFRDEMDVTVFAYLRMFRMLKASILLNTEDTKMLDVAYQCGYNSVSSFFTDFKKTFNCSPVQFRKLQKND